VINLNHKSKVDYVLNLYPIISIKRPIFSSYMIEDLYKTALWFEDLKLKKDFLTKNSDLIAQGKVKKIFEEVVSLQFNFINFCKHPDSKHKIELADELDYYYSSCIEEKINFIKKACFHLYKGPFQV